MAGDDSMTDLAEALAKAAGREHVAESVAETLDKHMAGNTATTAEQMSGLATQLDQLRQASQQQAIGMAENTTAVAQNTNTQGSLSLSSGIKPASVLSSIFGNGFGISPLLSGIMKLFGGGGDQAAETTAPVEYEKPAAVDFAGGYSRSGDGRLYALDYAAGDKLRLVREPATESSLPHETWSGIAQVLLRDRTSDTGTGMQTAATLDQLRQSATAASGFDKGSATSSPGTPSWEARTAPSTSTGTDSTAPQITVQVQAMDSRSFLDHSEEIACAVRQAMLNSHGINDVITEL